MPRLSTKSFAAGILVCVFATLDHLCAQTIVAGPPKGVIGAQFSVGNNAFSLPLMGSDIFRSSVSNNTTSSLEFSTGEPASLMASGKQYYIEVETGPFEGERFDINGAASSGASLALDLAAGSASTAKSIPAGTLAGARVVLREHVTLSSLKTLFSPPLAGHNSAALADGVQLFVNGALRSYYLRADGTTWREAGKAVNESSRVITPDTSLILVLRSGPRDWVHSGLVRTNVFRVNLPAGARAFATGYPLDLSPVQIGAFADPSLPAGQRWVGNDNPGFADMLQVFETDAFSTYYLRSDGVSWRRVGGNTDLQNSPLLRAIGTVIIKRANADAEALIIRPFSL